MKKIRWNDVELIVMCVCMLIFAYNARHWGDVYYYIVVLLAAALLIYKIYRKIIDDIRR